MLDGVIIVQTPWSGSVKEGHWLCAIVFLVLHSLKQCFAINRPTTKPACMNSTVDQTGVVATDSTSADDHLEKLWVVKQKSDGGCLFRSLAYGIGSDGNSLRRDICAFMAANPNRKIGGDLSLSEWVLFDSSPDTMMHENNRMCVFRVFCDYIERMAIRTTWGGELEMSVFAHMNAVCVRVYTYIDKPAGIVQCTLCVPEHLECNRAIVSVLYENDHYDALVCDSTDLRQSHNFVTVRRAHAQVRDGGEARPNTSAVMWSSPIQCDAENRSQTDSFDRRTFEIMLASKYKNRSLYNYYISEKLEGCRARFENDPRGGEFNPRTNEPFNAPSCGTADISSRIPVLDGELLIRRNKYEGICVVRKKHPIDLERENIP